MRPARIVISIALLLGLAGEGMRGTVVVEARA